MIGMFLFYVENLLRLIESQFSTRALSQTIFVLEFMLMMAVGIQGRLS